MTAPARHNHVFHGLKKPEIAYLPTACAETLPFPPPTVLSCYRPYMGWQSWRFEGQTFESPHILVYDLVPREPLAHVLSAIPGLALLVRDFAQASCAYLSSTFAPAFSSWALTFSASSLLTPSLTGFGAPSTRSLASLRPRPVMARTSLITSIFFSPAARRMTENSVFSSTGAAAAADGPASATPAAADTHHFSSSNFASSAASSTVRPERSSTIFCKSAIDLFP